MTREQLLALAGKGLQPYADSRIEVIVKMIEEVNAEIITIRLEKMNPYTTERRFGCGFFEDVTDEDCNQLETMLQVAIEEMKAKGRRAELPPMRFQRVGPRIIKHIDSGRSYGYEECKEGHFSVYTISRFDWLKQTLEFDSDIDRAVDIEGKVYKPVYSYWLGRTVFLLDSPDGYFPERSEQK